VLHGKQAECTQRCPRPEMSAGGRTTSLTWVGGGSGVSLVVSFVLSLSLGPSSSRLTGRRRSLALAPLWRCSWPRETNPFSESVFCDRAKQRRPRRLRVADRPGGLANLCGQILHRFYPQWPIGPHCCKSSCKGGRWGLYL